MLLFGQFMSVWTFVHEFVKILLVPILFLLFSYPYSLSVSTKSFLSISLFVFVVFQTTLFLKYLSSALKRHLIFVKVRVVLSLFHIARIINFVLLLFLSLSIAYGSFDSIMDAYCTYFFLLWAILEYFAGFKWGIYCKQKALTARRGCWFQVKRSRIKRLLDILDYILAREPVSNQQR